MLPYQLSALFSMVLRCYANRMAASFDEYLSQHQAQLMADLKHWLAIPSISMMPEHYDDVDRAADWLVGYLNEMGFA